MGPKSMNLLQAGAGGHNRVRQNVKTDPYESRQRKGAAG